MTDFQATNEKGVGLDTRPRSQNLEPLDGSQHRINNGVVIIPPLYECRKPFGPRKTMKGFSRVPKRRIRLVRTTCS